MASEINESYTTTATKGGATVSVSKSDTLDMSGSAMAQVTLTATTSWVALGLPAAVAAPCHIVVQNLDATNFVEIAVDSGGSNIVAKLLAGEFVQIKRIPAIPYIRANTASCACVAWAYQA